MNARIGPARDLGLAGRSLILPLPNPERQDSARAGSPATASKRFQDRARLYARLDARLRSKTRFFGAACVTNRVLSHLTAIVGAPSYASACADWLCELGAALEIVNRSIAAAVLEGDLAGPALDERIVFLEQSAVEQSLDKAGSSRMRPNFEILRAIDALLNHERWFSALHFSSTIRWYRRVLAEVRADLNAPIEFARQRHREKIGMALIDALRRGGAGAARICRR